MFANLLSLDRSSWSRASPYEVGDISKEKAEGYLVEQGLKGEDAKKAVRELTGGRLILLIQVLNEILEQGKSYEGNEKHCLLSAKQFF